MADIAVNYAKSLIGTLYVWWDGSGIPIADIAPFYAQNGPPPSEDFIRANGCCCAGI